VYSYLIYSCLHCILGNVSYSCIAFWAMFLILALHSRHCFLFLHCILGNVSYCSWCHETSVCFLFNCWKIISLYDKGTSWPWSYGSWIYNYLCNQCLSMRILIRASVQHYVIKFVSDLQQVGGFLWVLQFPPSIKLIATI
jgi:hypothetical protein